MGQYRDYALKRTKQFSEQLMMKGRARTAIGMAQTNAMIATAAHNLEVFTGGEDSFATAVKAFSKRGGAEKVKQFADNPDMPAFASVGEGGLSSIQNLQTVSAIDITIQTLIYSFLPWIAIERPMNDSTTTISWREIISTNNAAGVTKGETLIGNFKVENSAVDLSTPVKTLSATGAGEVLVIDFGAQLYEGTVLVQLTDTSSEPKTVVGKDYNGLIAFPGYSVCFEVDYENGTLTSKATVASTFKVDAQAMVDMFADKSAPNVLRSTSKMRSVQMVSRESGIIMEDSVDRMMFILKTLDQAGGAMSLEQYMSQMMFDLYVAYVNNLLMIGIHTRSQQMEGTDDLNNELTVDLTSYGSQIIADPSRKYDELNVLTNTADSYMLRTVNKGITAFVTGSKMCTLMASDKFRFKKSDTYNTQMNTLAGVYDGKPVLRHQYIDRYIDMNDDGFMNGFGVHRDPNGEVGFMCYGEYLPIHTTDNVYNYANPLQFAKALVAQIGTKIIEPGLCVRFRFKVAD